MTNINLYTILQIIVLGNLFIACSGGLSHNTLAFFFDGVPQSTSDSIAVTDSVTNTGSQFGADSAIGENMMIDQSITIHPLYRQKLCEKCHDVDHGYCLVQRQPELCYNCHKRFDSIYVKIHGPVSAGFCTACHVAHKSEHKALLIMPIRQICQHCHQPGDVAKNEAHEKISTVECLQCHNAHGGNTSDLLKN